MTRKPDAVPESMLPAEIVEVAIAVSLVQSIGEKPGLHGLVNVESAMAELASFVNRVADRAGCLILGNPGMRALQQGNRPRDERRAEGSSPSRCIRPVGISRYHAFTRRAQPNHRTPV